MNNPNIHKKSFVINPLTTVRFLKTYFFKKVQISNAYIWRTKIIKILQGHI